MEEMEIRYYKGIETDEDGNTFWYPVVKERQRESNS